LQSRSKKTLKVLTMERLNKAFKVRNIREEVQVQDGGEVRGRRERQDGGDSDEE
jgi:hypothetical protein